jgi:hypothetical protein
VRLPKVSQHGEIPRGEWIGLIRVYEIGVAGENDLRNADGIIELHWDNLRICYRPMGGPPPTEFTAKKDSGLHYLS